MINDPVFDIPVRCSEYMPEGHCIISDLYGKSAAVFIGPRDWAKLCELPEAVYFILARLRVLGIRGSGTEPALRGRSTMEAVVKCLSEQAVEFEQTRELFEREAGRLATRLGMPTL